MALIRTGGGKKNKVELPNISNGVAFDIPIDIRTVNAIIVGNLGTDLIGLPIPSNLTSNTRQQCAFFGRGTTTASEFLFNSVVNANDKTTLNIAGDLTNVVLYY